MYQDRRIWDTIMVGRQNFNVAEGFDFAIYK